MRGSNEGSRVIPGRERILFDEGWRFALGHASDPSLDFGHGTGYFSYLAKTGFGDGPAAPSFDDRAWRLLDLPHDWAVEAPFDEKASKSHGFKAVGPGFPESSVGWYRKRFFVPEGDLGRRVFVEFDGVYRSARVFVNGFLVGEEPSGYLSVRYDLTDYLDYGGDNVLSVRVDASQEEGWFYEGAGIYRHVHLLKTHPLHVGEYGTFVRTDIGDGSARVAVETTVEELGEANGPFRLELQAVRPDGTLAARLEREVEAVPTGTSAVLRDDLTVDGPALWSTGSPHLHRLVTTLRRGEEVLDRTETTFGIRSIRFDPDRGFFLNGERVQICGTNNHQDHAGVGVALPDALQLYRLRRLMDLGANAYRCSHHPPTPELLDACDRLGILVIDENRLMGSNPWHLRALERMIRRDRNHPSVILWSIGNEEWGIEGNVKGARIAATMQGLVHRLDPTRPATAAISGGWGGTSSVVDVVGVNYVKQGNTERQHKEFPWQGILGTEESTTNGTRGVYEDDLANAYLAPREDGLAGGNAEIGWKHYAERPFLAGLCYWTGFDYRGEPDPVGFPGVCSQFGILDTCGFPKDTAYYVQSQWKKDFTLHLAPHWNRPGREGKPIEVRVFSACEEVELFLNGASLGRKAVEPYVHTSWIVPYAPGKLEAVGTRRGKVVGKAVRETTGPAARIALEADRTVLRADGKDVAVVAVRVLDAEGREVPTAREKVRFFLEGPGRILGVGNGDPSCLEMDAREDWVIQIPGSGWVATDLGKGRWAFETRFDRPSAGAQGSLVPGAFVSGAEVTLNGRRLDGAFGFDQGGLKEKGNLLRVEGVPDLKPLDAETLKRFRPAFLRSVLPAEPWYRTTFNGLAQVIVQAGKEKGTLSLKAEGGRLEMDESVLRVE